VRILLDTHIFLWAITKDPRLTTTHRHYYLDPANHLHLSVVSVWEMLIKAGLGRLPLPVPATDFITKQMGINRITTLALHLAHFAELEKLPPLHRDPFDRMLVAQARVETMPILSADARVRSYDVALL